MGCVGAVDIGDAVGGAEVVRVKFGQRNLYRSGAKRCAMGAYWWCG